MAAAPLVIVFPLFPGITSLDFMGPQTVFGLLPGAKLIFASLGGQPIRDGELTFDRLNRLEDVERCDVLCVPGGRVADSIREVAFMDAIRRLAASARFVTSVCTGSLILGAAGLLEGKRAACHWSMREQLTAFGAIPDGGRVVRDGRIMTGGGVTAGIDFGLTLAAELAGPLVAQSIQLVLEYAPMPPFNAGRPELASQEVLTQVPLLASASKVDMNAEHLAVQQLGMDYRARRAGAA